MFKNLILCRITALTAAAIVIEESLVANSFTPCGPSQEKSTGWAPPRGEDHGAMLESVGGQWIMKLMTETRAVPGTVITQKAKERAKQIEATTGRKPGKKEMRDIKEDIQLELLPLAFPKESATLVWIDPVTKLLAIDASSQARADDVVTELVKAIDDLAVRLITTTHSPTGAMSEWLISQEPPAGFTVDQECELKAADETKATIKYGHHPLDIEEIKAHVNAGKLPTKLAMTYDDRISFVLTEGMQLKKIKASYVVFTETKDVEFSSYFDGNVVIATGGLARLVPDLLEALGGEVV